MVMVCNVMGLLYFEFVVDFEWISWIVVVEEMVFNCMLVLGFRLFEEVVSFIKKFGVIVLFGLDVFMLYDIYGFLIEFMLEMVVEIGLQVDEIGFCELMVEQCCCVKVDVVVCKYVYVDLSVYCELVDVGVIEFIGFDELCFQVWILGIFVDGKWVLVVVYGVVGGVGEGQCVEFVLDCILFYVELGGQIVDEGIISGIGFSEVVWVVVIDVQKIVKMFWVY